MLLTAPALTAGAEETNASYQAPPSEPECWPHPELDGVLACKPPAECVDHLYETPECTPPPACHDQGDGTFACEIPEHDGYEDHDRYRDEAHHEPAPSHDDSHAYPVVDGEPRAPAGLTMDEIARDLFGEGTLFDDEASLEEARRAARQAAEEAMAAFQANLLELKEAYVETREDLRDRYEVGRTELKAEHAACIEQARAQANASAARAEARACNQEARQALEELRSGLIEEHEALKDRILQDAERTRTSLCDRLEVRLGNILAGTGLLHVETQRLLGPGELPLCAHRIGGGLP